MILMKQYIWRLQNSYKFTFMALGKAIDRYMDADNEPTKTLTPIHGYEKTESKSLQKAMAEIKPPMDQFHDMVWKAKRKSHKSADNLTADESAFIHLYMAQWPEGQQSI